MKNEDLEAKLLANNDGEPPSPGTKDAAAGNAYSLVCTLLASLASIIYGYNRGVMSGAQKYVQADLNVSDGQLEVLIGLTSVYSLVGSLAAGWTCDRAGRRRTVAFSAAMFLAGSVVTAAANGYAVLMAGQLLAGVACGFGLVVAPVYIAEIAPAASRGFLSSIPEIAINLGILLSYIADFALAGLPKTLNWRLMIGIGAAPPLFLAASAMLEIVASSKQAGGPSGPSKRSVWREILLRPTPSVRRVMLVILGLQFFQQASGVAALLLYAPRVFGHVGVTSDHAVLGATILVGASKALFTLVPLFLADRLGRRPILLASAGGMAASLMVLGLSLRASTATWWAAATCVAAAVTFMATFSLGFGPVIWIYQSEVLPLRLRAQGTGVGTALNRMLSAVVGMTFISMYKAVGMAGSFYIFAAFSAVAWVFVYACLPETKGKSLEEMEALFDDSAGRKPQTPSLS
ncbi:hypothetical protein QOZ80_5AG0392220 [Eleusine coracana subsp. coracana]|nr:hypothetical protein QOZ80_5AG0392220 [Eleusine coracana subsp. coracana]